MSQVHLQAFEFHYDGAHEWLRVPVETVIAMGLTPSSCSYTDGDDVFLEGDRDAYEFDCAWKAEHDGIRAPTIEVDDGSESWIRGLEHYYGGDDS